jgi:hypothetical protein
MLNNIYVIAGTLAVVALLYLLRNVFKRIFYAIRYVILPNRYDIVKKEQSLKFAPLALLAGGIPLKLIAYGILIALVGTVCFGLYKKITQTTYSSDYKNNIHNNQDVIVDERAGNNTGCSFEFAYGLIKIGCKQLPITKTTNNTLVVAKKENTASVRILTPEQKIEEINKSTKGNKGVVTKGKK